MESANTTSQSGRSTANIIWSCISVLLICTYKCVHSDISSFEENEAGWYKINGIVPYWPQWPLVRKFGRKIRWMIIIILAPELGVAVAAKQHINAKNDLWEVQRWILGTGLEGKITLTHAFYARMNGFAASDLRRVGYSKPDIAESSRMVFSQSDDDAVRSSKQSSIDQARSPESQSSPCPRSDLVDVVSVDITDNSEVLHAITLADYVKYLQGRQSPERVLITQSSIEDRTKADAFGKIFAILQSSWLIIMSITRLSSGLPICLLELSTIAYFSCAVAMYILWWHKPFGVEHVSIIQGYTTESTLSTWTITHESDVRYDWHLDFLDLESPAIQIHKSHLIFYSAATIFSALHLAAWNYEFSSPAIRYLWRTLSLTTTIAPLLTFLVIYTFQIRARFLPKITVRRDKAILRTVLRVVIGPVYTTCRLGLIVLVIYSLNDMPLGVFETPGWTEKLPHFS
ncbi:hypothetical protein NHQ30_006588 [Ciborinia camelliae]|nr:hypothetical protein NHQ30_006588 [Ciborinia camelliae]